MLKKVFISPLFKFPIPWMAQYYDNFNALGPGWSHFIFTDQPLESRGNIVVIKTTVEWFSSMVTLKTGVSVKVPAPSPKFGDMRPAFGLIFEDYIANFDFWGHTDFDMVMGNLDKFLPEDILINYDILSDDPKAINGIFTLYRNKPVINWLFTKCLDWRAIFSDDKYHAFDEVEFTETVNRIASEGTIKFIDGKRHGNDKCGVGELIMKDGSLYQDGKEIMAFHFKKTKRWPL